MEVKTRSGPIKGSIISTSKGFPIYTYQGIPYAKPPVGELRLKNPVPIEPWNDVLYAVNEHPASPQYATVVKGLAPNSNEDCLYLNVYTPKAPDSNLKLPTMVWIHGGAFQHGCGTRNYYGPDYLVPEGVILVTINYRVGALGFLSFQNAECPGNFGLKDQTLALRWVRNNIGAFGGDPDNVTIFGQSAGAACVQFHLISKQSRGLFQRAIAQSGSALNRWAMAENSVKKGLVLAKRLGCDTTDPSVALKAIKQASIEDIVLKSMGIVEELEDVWDMENVLSMTFLPVAEPEELPDTFITKTAEQAVADGDYADVPVIMGITELEAGLFMSPPTFVPPYSKDEEFQKMLPKELHLTLNTTSTLAAAGRLRKFYFPKENTQRDYLRAISALLFTHGIFRTTRSHLNDLSKVSPYYLYVFDISRHPAPARHIFGTVNVPGTAHGDDVDFLFHPNHFIPGQYSRDALEPGTKEGNAQVLYTKLWTDFAKTGVPSDDWPPADPKNWPYVRITDVLEPKSGFFAEEMKLWDEIYDILKS